jgi:LPXTG-motif cell wall-anchored protein
VVTEPGLPSETVLFVPEVPDPDNGGGLPYTGSQPLRLLGAGLLALIAGGLLLGLGRRESHARG